MVYPPPPNSVSAEPFDRASSMLTEWPAARGRTRPPLHPQSGVNREERLFMASTIIPSTCSALCPRYRTALVNAAFAAAADRTANPHSSSDCPAPVKTRGSRCAAATEAGAASPGTTLPPYPLCGDQDIRSAANGVNCQCREARSGTEQKRLVRRGWRLSWCVGIIIPGCTAQILVSRIPRKLHRSLYL